MKLSKGLEQNYPKVTTPAPVNIPAQADNTDITNVM